MKHEPSFARLVCAFCIALTVPTGGNVRRIAAAQTEVLEGQEIVRIDFDIPPEVDLARIRSAIRIRVGDIYTGEAVQRDIAAIHALGEISDVRVKPNLVERGVVLTYRIQVHPKVQAIRFEGDLAFPVDKLRGLLTIEVGHAANPYVLKMDQRTLREYYQERGYHFADVGYEIRRTAEGVELIYHIEAGNRLAVEAIQFEGNEAIHDKDLRRMMISTKGRSLFSRGAFDPALLKADLRAIREMFRRKGYLDATVGHEILFDETKQRAYLVITIRQESLYRVERIIIRNTQVFTADELLNAMVLREGEPFAQEQLDEDIRSIKQLYGRDGYIKAAVRVERVLDKERPLVTLRLNIEEGPACTVNRVMIRGNWRTKDHVIRRDISLLPADRVNTDEVEKSKRRLVNTGLFFSLEPKLGEEPVQIRFLDTDDPDKTDVVVEVTEGGLGNIAVGAGWSSSTGLVGNLNVVLRNFDALDFPKSWKDFTSGQAWTGGGQELSISLSPGTELHDYRLGWSNPSVWDSPYFTGFNLFLQDFSWSQYYDQGRMGLGVVVGRRFLEDWQIAVSPRVERVEISDIDSGAPPDAFEAEGTHDRHAVTLSVSYDGRDNIFMPTTGYHASAAVEMGGTVLGGDVDFIRETIRARRWWTLWDQTGWGKHVINLGGEVGLLHTTNSDSVPIFERFFIGGLGSLRGFRYRRVGPVDAATARQVGGEYQVLVNTEYEAPLIKDVIRGVLFVDAGVLERSLSDLSLDRVRSSVGVGVRIRIPQLGMQKVPIGLYIATPLRKEDEDKTEMINFSIGTGFEF